MNDDLSFRIELVNPANELDSVRSGYRQVQKDQMGPEFLHDRYRIRRVASPGNGPGLVADSGVSCFERELFPIRD